SFLRYTHASTIDIHPLPYTTLFRSTQELNMFGHIIYAEVDQAIFGLVGEVQELEQEDGVRYFYYTGKIAQTGKPSEDKQVVRAADRKSTRLNSSHVSISYAVLCLKK